MLKIKVDSLVLNLTTNEPIIILKDAHERILPIAVGVFEIQAILLSLEKTKIFRPFTHDLLKNAICALGGRVLKLEIHSLKHNTYLANLIIKTPDKIIKIDCRPSDGIAIALRTNAPMYASKDILIPFEKVRLYQEKEFIQSGKLDDPIDTKETEEFKKTIEKISAKEFWKELNTK
jgi:bifunctional DNase/RNase